MKKYILLLIFLAPLFATSQNYYFPPTTGTAWDTVSPKSLNWCADKLDTVYKYLNSKSTKAFIILKGGKIAVEKYFGNFTQDSIWYWASAGKTITAYLMGIAQQEGKLKISDSTSKYLGKGWTKVATDKEAKITLWHQLTMTTGLDDEIAPTVQVPDPDNCTKPECLMFKANAGSRWAYHNAPYLLLQSVIDSATGLTMQQYTIQKLRTTTGMQGFWFDNVYYSRARDMARFGSLISNKGKWANTQLLTDTNYFNAMVNTSQSINPSYGYLWWLNGKSSYKAPTSQLDFNGPLVPNAPADMYAGLGKNDQKLYIIPSTDMVILRLGNSSGQPLLAISSFDNELWGLLKQVFCPNGPVNVGVEEANASASIAVYPNPAQNQVTVDAVGEAHLKICALNGQMVYQSHVQGKQTIDISTLAVGIYTAHITNKHLVVTVKLIKQ